MWTLHPLVFVYHEERWWRGIFRYFSTLDQAAVVLLFPLDHDTDVHISDPAHIRHATEEILAEAVDAFEAEFELSHQVLMDEEWDMYAEYLVALREFITYTGWHVPEILLCLLEVTATFLETYEHEMEVNAYWRSLSL